MAERVQKNEFAFLLHTEMSAHGCATGMINRLSCGEVVPFVGLDQALLMMNGWMDENEYCSDDASMRTFQTKNGVHSHKTIVDVRALERCGADQPENRSQWYVGRERRGAARRKETFLVRVICRQHTSWQGEICWRNQRIYFRSCLEMIYLIQSVLSGAGAGREKKAFPETGTKKKSAVAVVS